MMIYVYDLMKNVTMPRITFSIPDQMSDFINTQIETGKYDNVSEYLRDLIRHDQERKESAQAKLRAMLITAEQSGISNSTIDDVKQRVQEKLISEGNKLRN